MMKEVPSKIQGHWRSSRRLKSFLVILLVLCLAPIGITQAVRLGLYFKFLHNRKLPPTWHGLTVGQSNTADMLAMMGKPLEIGGEGDDTYYLYRDADPTKGPYRIVVRNSTVEWIAEHMLGDQKIRARVMLTEFVERYGKPDSVQWSTSDDGERVVIFLDDGVFVAVADPGGFEEIYVLDAFYYRPRPLPQVLRDFSAYVTESGVTGYCTDLDCVYWGPKDPWYGWFGGPYPDWLFEWLMYSGIGPD